MAHIKTYGRVKPSANQYDDFDCALEKLYIRVPENLREQTGLTRTARNTVNHEFKFTQVFDASSTQEQVFDTVAADIVQGFLTGFNGTIFAYGQTGSGKTFTMEGSARRYQDRGLAPRALSMIYKALASRQEQEDIRVHVSYLEIYQEVGYDLLNPTARSNSLVTTFPKVAVVEGTKGSCLVRNLSSHLAATEEVAQQLLLQGQANRRVAETPMNQRSSRSHAVFTIQLTVKPHDSDVITSSKLHLVDLAGSERVSKTGIDGVQLAEAKYINLSLHYLESVIIALQQDPNNRQPRPRLNNLWASRLTGLVRPSSADGYRPGSPVTYIPYRNSLLTMVLRDSLGGNCQTAMVATLNMEEMNLNESVSTGRFAQRVACITNTLRKNEEIDDKSMIRKLRKRIAELETQVALLKAGKSVATDETTDTLLAEEKEACERVMRNYIGGKVTDPVQAGITNVLKFRECLQILKSIILEYYARGLYSVSGGLPADLLGSPMPSKDTFSPSSRKPPLQQDRPMSHVSATSTVSNATSGFDESGVPIEQDAGHSDDKPKNVSNKPKRASSAPTSRKRAGTSPVQQAARSSEMSGTQRKRASQTAVSSSSAGSTVRGTREPYKSPFERKKEKEIKRLRQRVGQLQLEQAEQQQHLHQFQVDVREQQLGLICNELRNKIESTKLQVADQHAYLVQLRRDHADRDLLKQEKLVERQLKKRQVKMERRLQLLQDQLQQAEAHADELQQQAVGQQPSGSGSQPLQAKLAKYASKEGHVNTRQVLNALSMEEKHREKVQSRIDAQRVMVLSQQLEVKEAATRQKLREFRKKLQQTKLGEELSTGPRYTLGGAEDPSRTSSASQSTCRPYSSPEASKPVWINQLDSSITGTSSGTMDVMDLESSHCVTPTTSANKAVHKWLRNSQPSPYDKNSSSAGQSVDYSSQEEKKNGRSFPLQTRDLTSIDSRLRDIFAPYSRPDSSPSQISAGTTSAWTEKKDPGDLWNSGYSHKTPTWPERQSTEPQRSADPFEQLRIPKPEVASIPVKESGYEDIPWPFTENTRLPQSGDEDGDEMGNDFVSTYCTRKSGHCQDDEEIPVMADGGVAQRRDSIHFGPKQAESVDMNRCDSNSRRGSKVNDDPEDLLDKITNESDSEIHSNGQYNGDTRHTTPKRYVSEFKQEQQESKDSFDWRRIGFGDATFDSALTSMLGMEPRIDWGPEQYDQFARRKGPRQSSRSPERKQKASQQKDQSPTRGKLKSASDSWGPESKKMPIADRLSKYLDQSTLTTSPPKKIGQSLDDSGLHTKHQRAGPKDWQKKVASAESGIHLDIDRFRPKIKAFGDEEGEDAYMKTAREQKERIKRIRQARNAAEVIQKAWRRYALQKGIVGR